VTAALNGTPYTFAASPTVTAYATLNGYSYLAGGVTTYALVYHLAPSIVGAAGVGVVAVFLH
jgi:hypothetical protein